MAKLVFSPEDKEASRRRLMEVQRAYHSHAQDLVESFHSPDKTSEYLRKHAAQRAREAKQREETMSAAAKADALAAAAALEMDQAKSFDSSPKATPKPQANPRFLWKKTIATVQKEIEAKARRQARESMTRIKGFGGGTLI